jgi:hypothetical protein
MNKEAKRKRNKEVTPEFAGYLKINFIPPNSGCYKSNPLNRISPPRFKKMLARTKRLVHGWFTTFLS